MRHTQHALTIPHPHKNGTVLIIKGNFTPLIHVVTAIEGVRGAKLISNPEIFEPRRVFSSLPIHEVKLHFCTLYNKVSTLGQDKSR